MSWIFRGFCINRFGIGPLHYLASRSDFGLEFSEIFVMEKRLPNSFFDYEYLREFEVKIGTARKVV